MTQPGSIGSTGTRPSSLAITMVALYPKLQQDVSEPVRLVDLWEGEESTVDTLKRFPVRLRPHGIRVLDVAGRAGPFSGLNVKDEGKEF